MARSSRPLTVLLTRGLEQARPLANALQASGWHVILNPLLTFKHKSFTPQDPLPFAWIVTSQQGVPALLQLDPHKKTPVFAVGPATQKACMDAGFQALDGGGDALHLLALLQREIAPRDGPLIHLSGAHIRVDVTQTLKAKGYDCRRLVVYEALARPSLGKNLRAALETRTLTHAVFFSPRTAQIFVDLMKENPHLSVEDVCALGVSEAIVEALASLPWKARLICKDPLKGLEDEKKRSTP